MTIPTKHWLPADAVLPPEEDGVSRETPEQRPRILVELFPEWHARARCRWSPEPDVVFFDGPEGQHRPAFTITQINEVKKFCGGCEVFATCLTHALTQPEQHGIWAGTSKRTRQRILALVKAGEVTVAEVVNDYLHGRGKKYETLRRAS